MKINQANKKQKKIYTGSFQNIKDKSYFHNYCKITAQRNNK